jgi:hypothetical protein
VQNQALKPVPNSVRNNLDFSDVFGLVASTSKKLTVLSQTDFEHVKVLNFVYEGLAYHVEAWSAFQGKSEEESAMEQDSLLWTFKDNLVQYDFDIGNDLDCLDSIPYVNFPQLQRIDTKSGDEYILIYLGVTYRKLVSIKEISDFENSRLKDHYKWMHDILIPEIKESILSRQQLTIWIREMEFTSNNEIEGANLGGEDIRPSLAGDALLFSQGKGSNSNKWSFVELFRTRDVIHGFNLTEKGRKLYRTLVFASDLRQVLLFFFDC